MSVQMDEFWSELAEAVKAAPYMLTDDAAGMMARRLDEYRGLWPHIEADIATDQQHKELLERAICISNRVECGNLIHTVGQIINGICEAESRGIAIEDIGLAVQFDHEIAIYHLGLMEYPNSGNASHSEAELRVLIAQAKR